MVKARRRGHEYLFWITFPIPLNALSLLVSLAEYSVEKCSMSWCWVRDIVLQRRVHLFQRNIVVFLFFIAFWLFLWWTNYWIKSDVMLTWRQWWQMRYSHMPKMLPAGRRYTYGDIRRFTCADVSSDIRRDGGSDRFVSKQAQVIKCQNLFIVFLCDRLHVPPPPHPLPPALLIMMCSVVWVHANNVISYDLGVQSFSFFWKIKRELHYHTNITLLL